MGFRQASICDCGEHGFVGLTRARVSLFSPQDLGIVSKGRWSAHLCTSRCIYGRSKIDGKFWLLHRLILNPPLKMYVDHINRDTLDNRRENIRLVSHQQNMWNSGSFCKNGLPKGVTKAGKKFSASITKDGKRLHIGLFETPREAGKAYQRVSKFIFGEYAAIAETGAA